MCKLLGGLSTIDIWVRLWNTEKNWDFFKNHFTAPRRFLGHEESNHKWRTKWTWCRLTSLYAKEEKLHSPKDSHFPAPAHTALSARARRGKGKSPGGTQREQWPHPHRHSQPCLTLSPCIDKGLSSPHRKAYYVEIWIHYHSLPARRMLLGANLLLSLCLDAFGFSPPLQQSASQYAELLTFPSRK